MFYPVIGFTINKEPEPNGAVFYISHTPGHEHKRRVFEDMLKTWTREPLERDLVRLDENTQRERLAIFIRYFSPETKLHVLKTEESRQHTRYLIVQNYPNKVNPELAELSDRLKELVKPIDKCTNLEELNTIYGELSLLNNPIALQQRGLKAVFYKVQQLHKHHVAMLVDNALAANTYSSFEALMHLTNQYLILDPEQCPDDTTTYIKLAKILVASGVTEPYTVLYSQIEDMVAAFVAGVEEIVKVQVIGHTLFIRYVDFRDTTTPVKIHTLEAPLRHCLSLLDGLKNPDHLYFSVGKLIGLARSERETRQFLAENKKKAGEYSVCDIPRFNWLIMYCQHYLTDVGQRDKGKYPIRNKHHRWAKHLGFIRGDDYVVEKMQDFMKFLQCNNG